MKRTLARMTSDNPDQPKTQPGLSRSEPGSPKIAMSHIDADRLKLFSGRAHPLLAQKTVTGLVRESVMARLFGAGLTYDAFMLGFRIPNLTRDLFAEGALSSAFVPTFTEYLSTRSKEEAVRLVNLVATVSKAGPRLPPLSPKA